MIVSTINAGQTAPALEVGQDARITAVGGYVQYTADSLVAVRNGVATWTTWPVGAVAGAANTVSGFVIRLVGITDGATLDIAALDKSGAVPVAAVIADADGVLYTSSGNEI